MGITHISHDERQNTYRSRLETDRLARQENDLVRREIDAGQYNLFNQGINAAINQRIPGDALREIVRQMMREMKRDCSSNPAPPGRKLILLACY